MKSEELQKLWDAGVMKFKTKNECQKFLWIKVIAYVKQEIYLKSLRQRGWWY